MKLDAITLYQPWAQLILAGYKTIETRTHSKFARLKGRRIAIHAGRTFDIHSGEMTRPYLMEFTTLMRVVTEARLNMGVLLCTATVYDTGWLDACHSGAALCDCSGRDRYGLFLCDVQPIVPTIPWRGSQGIFTVEVP